MKKNCLQHIAAMRERAITLQCDLTAFRAMGPENGGDGESRKAAYLEERLRACGITDILHVDSPDIRVSSGLRPNIISRVRGKSPRTLWVFGHMDVVPAGDASLWNGDPWTVRVDGDKLIGRGVEDNQQAIVSALLTAEALHATQTVPDITLGMVFMADEECGNAHGLAHVLRTRPDCFGADDLYLVPDSGSPDGSRIEVAEKGVLWFRFSVLGAQTHASTPHKGNNACVAGAALTLELARLVEEFPATNALFSPACSTFTPTRREANVPNVNTVPGTDVQYLDCRLLPELTLDTVRAAVRRRCDAVEARYRVTVRDDVTHWLPPTPPTPVESPVVQRLAQAVRDIYHVEPRPVGIGGSTVACLLRERGLPAAVWARILHNCHEPDETALISSAIGDAQVFVSMLFDHE